MGKYFSIEELTHSNTAKRKNIDNTPNEEQLKNLENVIKVLDVIREAWDKPILVNSGYRSEALNKAVGGVKTSHHLQGKAADITAGTKIKNKKLFDLIIKLKDEGKIKFTQLIDESHLTWIHIGIDNNNLKNQILKL